MQTNNYRRSLDFARDHGVGMSRARSESARDDQLAERRIFDLLKIDMAGYDPGQLPCSHELARSVDFGSSSWADRSPFPADVGAAKMSAPTNCLSVQQIADPVDGREVP